MDDEAELRQLLGVYEHSLNTSDTDLAVSCYSASGSFMPTGAPTAEGAEQVRDAYAKIFATIRLRVTFTIEELSVPSPSLAYALTQSRGTQTVLSTDVQTPEANREMFIFTHDAGWKILRYMFNKPA